MDRPLRKDEVPRTPAAMKEALPKSHRLSWFRPGRTVVARNTMQRRYEYELEARPGRGFDPEFKPAFTPAQMLKAGVFEGKYLNDCMGEFPREWFRAALAAGKLRPGPPSGEWSADPDVNAFGVKSRLSLAEWRKKGWIPVRRRSGPRRGTVVAADRDNRGWFQWYCRYWLGRRLPEVDAIQIARWKSYVRHEAQAKATAKRGGDFRRSAQGLLQWARRPPGGLPRKKG